MKGKLTIDYLLILEPALDLIVTESNRYYEQCLIDGIVNNTISKNSLISK